MYNQLHNAAKDPSKNGFTQVQKLIAHGADVNAKHTQYGTTPIAFAAQAGSLSTLQFLLLKGANLDASNQERNLLHYALSNSPDVINFVTSKDVYKQFNDGTTDLHAAAAAGRLDEVKAILAENPERIREKNNRNETPLYWAAAGWAAAALQEEVFQYILNHPAYKALSIDDIDDDSRLVSDVFNVTANHCFDNNKKFEAISLYEKAIHYRLGVVEKNDGDHKNLAMYYSNLGGAYVYLYTNEFEHGAILSATTAFQNGKEEAEKIQVPDADVKKLSADCVDGLLTIQGLMQNQTAMKQKKSYRSALAGNQADRYMPGHDNGVVFGRTNYGNNDLDHVISGWGAEYSEPRRRNGGAFSFFSGITGGVTDRYAAYAAKRRAAAEEQEALMLARVLEESKHDAELREEAIAMARRLREDTEGFGFNIAGQLGDGNCLFYSIAHQLTAQNLDKWKGVTFEQLRIIATNHLDKHKDYYRQFTAYDEDHAEDKDTKNVHKNHTWADHLSIMALSRELNVNIFIVQVKPKPQKPQKPGAVKQPKEFEGGTHVLRQVKPDATLYVAYTYPLHYDSLVPKNGDFKPSEAIQAIIDKEHIDSFENELKLLQQQTPATAASTAAGEPPLAVENEPIVVSDTELSIEPIELPAAPASDVEMADVAATSDVSPQGETVESTAGQRLKRM